MSINKCVPQSLQCPSNNRLELYLRGRKKLLRQKKKKKIIGFGGLRKKSPDLIPAKVLLFSFVHNFSIFFAKMHHICCQRLSITCLSIKLNSCQFRKILFPPKSLLWILTLSLAFSHIQNLEAIPIVCP